MSEPEQETMDTRSIFIRIWPVYVFTALVIIAILVLRHYNIGLDTLRDNYQDLSAYVSQNFVLAVALFILAYFTVTAFSLPLASVLTISGGALFGLLVGSLSTIIGATFGACAIFLATNSFLGKPLREQAGPFLKKMEAGFNESPVTYMFGLRLVPVFPFYIVNIAPALFGVKLRDYFVTTALGIVPGVVAYTWIGTAIRETLSTNEEIDIAVLAANFSPAFAALAVVAIIPVLLRLYKTWSAAR